MCVCMPCRLLPSQRCAGVCGALLDFADNLSKTWYENSSPDSAAIWRKHALICCWCTFWLGAHVQNPEAVNDLFLFHRQRELWSSTSETAESVHVKLQKVFICCDFLCTVQDPEIRLCSWISQGRGSGVSCRNAQEHRRSHSCGTNTGGCARVHCGRTAKASGSDRTKVCQDVGAIVLARMESDGLVLRRLCLWRRTLAEQTIYSTSFQEMVKHWLLSEELEYDVYEGENYEADHGEPTVWEHATDAQRLLKQLEDAAEQRQRERCNDTTVPFAVNRFCINPVNISYVLAHDVWIHGRECWIAHTWHSNTTEITCAVTRSTSYAVQWRRGGGWNDGACSSGVAPLQSCHAFVWPRTCMLISHVITWVITC